MTESGHEEDLDRFFASCASGDVAALRDVLNADPELIRASRPHQQYGGWTGLHSAAQAGQPAAVRLLLERGADPNAREQGDHTYPLHWAAAGGHLEVASALLDAGGDVHGEGDAHAMDVIGWATFHHGHGENPNELSPRAREMVTLLVGRGARHHIFSALSVGDVDLIRRVVAENPQALERRMSKFEHGLTAVHFAISRKRYDLLDVLISLGADLESRNMDDQTPLETAMLRGDVEAMRRLIAAGAKRPNPVDGARVDAEIKALAGSTRKIIPMIMVPDVAKALNWYTSIGFTELGRYGDDGVVNFGIVSFGEAQLMFNMHGKTGRQPVSLWFYTDRVDELYRLVKAKQFDAAAAALDRGSAESPRYEIVHDLYEPFYGGREFGVRDLNGYELWFRQDG